MQIYHTFAEHNLSTIIFMAKKINHVLILFLFCCTYSTHIIAQSQTEMIKKAREMGIPESEIRKQLEAKEKQAGTAQPDMVLSMRDTSVNANLLDKVRQQIRKDSLDKIVFGREIFSSPDLTFEPNYNMATPQNYKLAAGDEIVINVWGSTDANYRQRISPDGTINIERVGLISLVGLTIKEAEEWLKQQLSQIYSGLTEDGGDINIKVSLGQIRTIKVNIVGEAGIPGTYTLPSLATLFNALYVAKGVNEIGTLRNIKLFRNNKEIAVLDVYDYLLNGKLDADVRLEDNDLIVVEPYKNLVAVDGKLKRERIFELKDGESLEDLIKYAGGFAADAYSDRVQVSRKNGTKYQMNTVEKENYPMFIMRDGDKVVVKKTIPMYENRLIIKGAVWQPGEFELTPATQTVKKLIKAADGLKGDAFTDRAQITRMRPDFSYEIIPVDIKAIFNDKAPDIFLQNEDELYIPSIYDLQENFTITVRGEVNNAVAPNTKNENTSDKFNFNTNENGPNQNRPRVARTVFPFKENMTVEDAILLAGGLKESASEAVIQVSRRIKNSKSMEFTDTIARNYTFSIDKNLKIDPSAKLFTLQPFDEIFVRRSPGYQEQQIVRIEGEVLFPGLYVLSSPNERLSDLIKRAGGISPQAYIQGASLKRKKTEDDRMKEMALLTLQSQDLDSLQLSKVNQDSMYIVGIDLSKALNAQHTKDKEYNIVLKENDVLTVPRLTNTVKIDGSVMFPNTTSYQQEYDLKDYIDKAGGYSKKAHKKPYVIYMNGQVATTKNGFFKKKYPKIEPGCEIVVPQKEERRRMSIGEIVGISSSVVSLAAIIITMTNNLK